MNLKEEKLKRNNFLYEVYKEAKDKAYDSPTSIPFGLSVYQKYSLATKEYINNDSERGGYIIGERIGLTQEEVRAFVKHFVELGYMNSGLGMQLFFLTQSGIMYLESLEEEFVSPIQINNNNISFGNNAVAQIQQNVSNSSQRLNYTYTKDDIEEVFRLLKSDFVRLTPEQKEELSTEIEIAIKQLEKGKDVKSRLSTIGEIVKDIGVDVFVGLASSPIVEILKPMLGI